MERKTLIGKQTPGEITYAKSYTDSVYEVHWSRDGECTAEIVHGEANAALYCEAHNVANESSLWPREMQERIKKLEEVLRRVVVTMVPLDSDDRAIVADAEEALGITTPSTIN